MKLRSFMLLALLTCAATVSFAEPENIGLDDNDEAAPLQFLADNSDANANVQADINQNQANNDNAITANNDTNASFNADPNAQPSANSANNPANDEAGPDLPSGDED